MNESTLLLICIGMMVWVVGMVPCIFYYTHSLCDELEKKETELEPTANEMAVELSLFLILWPIVVPFALIWKGVHKWHYKASSQ